MAEKHEKGLPEIGYLYQYPKIDQLTGNFQLTIFISNIPTEKHFDVYRVNFYGINQQNKFVTFNIAHPCYLEKCGRACAGVITMIDRNGVKEDAFTFGSEFKVEVKQSQTVVTLISAAPILDINEANPLRMLFLDEVCALLAQQRIRFRDAFGYFNELCRVEPFTLYLACVDEIINRLEKLPNKSGSYEQLLIELRSLLHSLQTEGLPAEVRPSLDGLFSLGC